MAFMAKHRTIYQTLAGEIRSGIHPVGSCLPTENELAERFGVARQTVLKALDALKTEGLLTSRRGLGTFVASPPEPLPARGERQLGFVCTNLQDSFGHQVFLGFEDEAARYNYAVVAGNSAYDATREAAHLKRLRKQGIAGVAIIPFFQFNRAMADELHREGWPLICIDNDYGIPTIPRVATDNFQAAYDAASFLIAGGRRRIGYITNTFEALQSVHTAQQRFEGYRKALADNGIAYDPALIQELGNALSARRPIEVGLDIYGYQAMHKLLNINNPPDAVLLQWDELAPGALNAIRNSQLDVPGDIAIIGFNDDDLCTLLNPQLTTIRQPARELGAIAARKLIDLIDGRRIEPETVLRNQLIFRATTRINPVLEPTLAERIG